jgi:hypothetical protein
MVSRAASLLLVCRVLSACTPIEEEEQAQLMAVTHAIAEGRRIQARAAGSGKCPDTLPGWKLDQWKENLQTRAGTKRVSYKLSLECKDLEFSILVAYSFDSASYVSGRATGPLQVTYGHFTAPCAFEVSAADDIAAAATKAVLSECDR